jgi:hypothetical protein
MSKVVIIVLKPKKGRTEELLAMLKRSIVVLQKLGVATNREQILSVSEEGTILQIFEWAGVNGQESAAEHEEIRDLWMEAERLSEFMKPNTLKEFNEVFPSFTVIQ